MQYTQKNMDHHEHMWERQVANYIAITNHANVR